jgi:hypothetical protein
MAQQAGNEQGRNELEMSYVVRHEVKEILRQNPLMNKKSSIEMLKYYQKYMKPDVARRAVWTIQCLKYNLAWDIKTDAAKIFR